MKPLHLLLAVVLCAVFPGAASAVPSFADIAPKNVLTFITVKNISSLRQKLKSHSLNALWNEPSVRQFVTRARNGLEENIRRVEGSEDVTLAQIEALLSGQAALFSVDTEYWDTGYILLLEVGDNEELAMDVVSVLVRLAGEAVGEAKFRIEDDSTEERPFRKVFVEDKDQGASEFAYAVVDGVLVAGRPTTAVYDTMSALYDPPQEPLSSLKAYADALNRVSEESDIIAFANVAQMLAVHHDRDRHNSSRMRRLNRLGMNTCIAASAGVQVAADELVVNAFINITDPARGIMKALMPEPGALHTAEDVPADAADFLTCRFDPAKDSDVFWSMMMLSDSQNLRAIVSILARPQRQQAKEPFSFRDDVLAVLGPRWSRYHRYERSQDGIADRPQSITMVDIPSKAAFEAALQKVQRVSAISGMIDAQDYLGHKVYILKPPQFRDALPGLLDDLAPAFTSTQSKLIIANSAGALKAHLRRLNRNVPWLADSKGFQEAIRNLPSDGKCALSFVDTKQWVETKLGALRGTSLQLEAGFHRKPNKTDALRGLFDLKQFPPKEDIFKHFGTSGAVGTVLPDGVLLTGRVPAHP